MSLASFKSFGDVKTPRVEFGVDVRYPVENYDSAYLIGAPFIPCPFIAHENTLYIIYLFLDQK